MKQEILIVEDNEDNSILAEKILNYFGFHTVTAPNGKEALELCNQRCFDLILMDLSLPDIDGLEVTRQLRQKKEFEHTPIIALTAHTLHTIQESTQEAGFTDFLSKPFLPKDLLNLTQKYLRN